MPTPGLMASVDESGPALFLGLRDTASGKTDRTTTTAAGGGFVLVHAGAGHHSQSKAREYRRVCKRACQRAVGRLRAGSTAVEAAEAALVALEDSPLTNAGRGSNLTLRGEVECDASIMDGCSLDYGAVGAVVGVKNPILAAGRILSEARGRHGGGTPLPAGRVPPCLLVGRGALDWAVERGVALCTPEEMVTASALSAHRRNKRRLELAEKTEGEKTEPPNHAVEEERLDTVEEERLDTVEEERLDTVEEERLDTVEEERLDTVKEERLDTVEEERLDTVGAVVVDGEGNVAAAVSSGGMALKQPGRVGQAAHYGSGCWAQSASSSSSSYATAASTSGCGEQLIRTTLARECCAAMRSSEDNHTDTMLKAMRDGFVGSPFLAGEERALGGVVALRRSLEEGGGVVGDDGEALVEFLWTHTTESMCVGFMSCRDSSRATAHISRLPPGAVPGRSLVIEGGVCRLANTHP